MCFLSQWYPLRSCRTANCCTAHSIGLARVHIVHSCVRTWHAVCDERKTKIMHHISERIGTLHRSSLDQLGFLKIFSEVRQVGSAYLEAYRHVITLTFAHTGPARCLLQLHVMLFERLARSFAHILHIPFWASAYVVVGLAGVLW